MARLVDQIDEIRRSNPVDQEIQLRNPHEWLQLIGEGGFPNVERIYRNLRYDTNERCNVVSREDIVSSRNNPEECIIKAMMWAFPENVENSPVGTVIGNMQSILNTGTDFVGKKITETEFLRTTIRLLNIPGIGNSSVSIILYALDISYDWRKSVAITNHTLWAFRQFDELRDYCELGYIPQLMKLNLEAKTLNVDVEQLEYYLYRVSTEKLNLI